MTQLRHDKYFQNLKKKKQNPTHGAKGQILPLRPYLFQTYLIYLFESSVSCNDFRHKLFDYIPDKATAACCNSALPLGVIVSPSELCIVNWTPSFPSQTWIFLSVF